MSYRFELATEMPGNGGKFDDLVFRYRQIIVPEKGTTQEGYRYRFLQAKHKQDESLKITASQLLKGDEGDFSLSKYFRSYCCDVNRRRYKPTDVQNCILCTNIGIDEIDLLKQGIELLQVSPPTSEKDILSFENQSGE